MTDYIIEPLDTSADEIFQNFVNFVQTTFPDWQPSEGQLDVIIARYFSMQAAFTADMASRVERAIFRYFGSSLANIPPLAGTSAQALVHFLIDDPSEPPIDRTLAFGTLVALTNRDGDSFAFATADDLIVPAGSTDAEVLVQAVDIGVDGNAITGTVEMVEQTDWIGSGYVVGESSGGSDDEEDDVYIQRLTDNLRLMAPRPILADDFAVFAQNVPGVWRAAVIDNFGGGALEQQRISTDATSGTWLATWRGSEASVPILVPSSKEAVESALAGLSVINDDDINVTGGPLPDNDIVVEFKGRYGYANQPSIFGNTDNLIDWSEFSIVQIQAGAPYNVGTENSISISAVDVDGNPLPPSVKNDLIEYLASTRPQNFIITFIDPAYHTVDVNYTVRAIRYQDPDSLKTVIDANLQNYLSPANWGKYPYQSQTRAWILQPVVRYLELTTIVENILGVDYVDDLSFKLDDSAMDQSDKTFSGGVFNLVRIGTITGVVNLPV